MKSLALVFGSTALAILMIEIVTRVFLPFPLADRLSGGIPYHYDAELGWAGDAGIDRELVFPESRFRVRTNRWGFRDEEPNDEPAIVFLGDSFAWGWGVEEEQRFSELVGAIRGERTINVSLPGYGPDQELLAYWRLAEREHLRPKAIVLAISSNDTCDLISPQRYGMERPTPLECGEVPLDWAFWEKHSADVEREIIPERLWSHSMRWARTILVRRALAAAQPSCEALGPEQRYAEHVLGLIVREFEKDARTLVVLIPGKGEREREGWRSRLSRDLDALDLGASVLTTGSHFRLDPHWTPEAHRTAAELIARSL